MFRIIKNTLKILLKRKSFLFVTFVLPAILIFFFSSAGEVMSSINIGIYNKDKGDFGKAIEEGLEKMNGANISFVDSEEEYISNLIFEECSVVVIIDENFTEDIINGKENIIKVKSINAGEAAPIVTAYLEGEVSSLAMICNNVDVEKEGIEKVLDTFSSSKPEYNNISEVNKSRNPYNAMGMVLYIIFITAAMSCGFILEDERQNTKERILLSKVSERQYYGAQLVVYFLTCCIPAIEYYIICKLGNFDFGFKNDFIVLLLLFILVLMAISLGLFLSSIIKNKMIFSLVMTTFTIPVFMLSGSYWPFEMMSKGMQRVGNVLPIRWFYIILEKLSANEGVMSILPLLGCLLLLTLVLFLLSVFCTKNKIVLVKEAK
ncbi:ABC-2 type transporter [Clostridium bornimense]|uniref:ABC-2 type transporter n=1 Tax=Clostridium bornimense TaxID=1216932 RepID=W6S6Q7_9CLOT|nr:ABC transporter permease [Clostridium bornimense]CDM70067.1 ABC-2 type transporter [Clostridium bornimense]